MYLRVSLSVLRIERNDFIAYRSVIRVHPIGAGACLIAILIEVRLRYELSSLTVNYDAIVPIHDIPEHLSLYKSIVRNPSIETLIYPYFIHTPILA